MDIRGCRSTSFVELRAHGVDPDYVRELAALGYARLPVGSLKRLRSHGIDPDYIRSVQRLGYARPSLDELTSLRAHGIEVDEIINWKSTTRHELGPRFYSRAEGAAGPPFGK